ncbi:MAG: NADH-quinone oxidoreductase subunit I [Dehalococcoidales bacterium]|nr:NADH-quinone oxidoreductase subunit I [Dehalococcoidales bacterium]MDP7109686.1 NADH-quinone oxidoreductase subunit I [Dehalococcoidales bacterium]MDP7309928.1 NADH-quinone oxidoreductase subunit I [Dehalococcoidales bacterium]MDP7409858.1 NADH-quinone oxidoreductase subunit I [Dehalococcoidales bacterium]MDP7676238.1 NADH-quinone oxidoreductase subunit I [Dehalococcoidales bacterium]
MKFEHYGIGIAKGLTVTLRHLFRHPVTVQYPDQRLHTSRRIRGNELVWNEEKCTGCATCAQVCHIGAINIVTSPSQATNTYTVEKYEVDTGYCIMCGLCVEACPFKALYMGYDYERAKYRSGDLVQTKEMMMTTPEKHISGYFYPELATRLPMQTLLLEKVKEDE